MNLVLHPNKIPLRKAWVLILFSMIFVSGTSWMGYLYYLHLKQLKMQDEQYQIVAIIQTSPQKEALKTVYLAELLNLSMDKPTNLYQFNPEEAEAKLLSSPVIKDVTLKRVRPGTLYIDYSVRHPLAYLGDYTNTALDKDRILIPFNPFFTPKKIPKVYIGLASQDKKWGDSLKGELADLAFQLLDLGRKISDEENIYLKQVDVSKAQAESYGQRQIVVVFEELLEQKIDNYSQMIAYQHILRLNAEDYSKGLEYYVQVRRRLAENSIQPTSLILDFRIPELAFIKKLKEI